MKERLFRPLTGDSDPRAAQGNRFHRLALPRDGTRAMSAVWQDHSAVRTVPLSACACDCPPDWPRSLVLRLVQRGSSPASGVDIDNSSAWCRGTARCRRIHPMLLRVEPDSARIGLHSQTVLQFFVAWHARAYFRVNLKTISARSAIGFGHISHRRLASPLQCEERLDWGLI